MGSLQVARWRRYGHDRLYVNDEAGTIGWVDVTTGERRLLMPERAKEFDAALVGRPELGGVVQLAVPTPRAPSAPILPRGDLALNRPGALTLAQAQQVREAAPWKSFFGRLLGVRTEERPWRIGGIGEQKVARELERLGPKWRILHSIPVGSGNADIDHLVIGPGGIFTVNTKHRPDASIWAGGETILVNGRNEFYVRNSRHEAARASRLLAAAGIPVEASGLVVFVGHDRLNVKEQPRDGSVAVLERRQVVRWLRRAPVRLTPEQVARAYQCARRPETWKP